MIQPYEFLAVQVQGTRYGRIREASSRARVLKYGCGSGLKYADVSTGFTSGSLEKTSSFLGSKRGLVSYYPSEASIQ